MFDVCLHAKPFAAGSGVAPFALAGFAANDHRYPTMALRGAASTIATWSLIGSHDARPRSSGGSPPG